MNTYYEIVKEYKRGFSTKKYAKKYFSFMFLFNLSILAVLAIICAAWAYMSDSIPVFIGYVLLIAMILWLFLRKLRKVDGSVIQLINKSKLERLLFKYQLLLQNDPQLSRHRLTQLTTMMNRELPKKKLSVRIFSPILFVSAIVLRYLASHSKLISPYLKAELIALFVLLLLFVVTAIVPTFQIILNRGYNKEVEFRDRIDELLLTSSLSFQQSSEHISLVDRDFSGEGKKEIGNLMYLR
ncbi:hypothetical protein ACI48J_15850 [Paenibacillus chitinolyticus]|uniref:hypothetical protein n=1 Tax=Paenibacillus chitinolyticus TaxID=79263 RepID=UPI0038658C54